MKKTAIAAFATIAALGLSACGSSEKASEEATAENVEMPAEEAMNDVDATAAPSEAAATPSGAATDAGAAAADATSAPMPAGDASVAAKPAQ